MAGVLIGFAIASAVIFVGYFAGEVRARGPVTALLA